MYEALKEARLAFSEGEVPVGAILVYGDSIVARGRNNRVKSGDITGHAELCVLREAGNKLGLHALEEMDLYTTLEPCPMCLGAILQSRIKNLYFGAYDKTLGAVESYMKVYEFPDSSRINIQGGILEEESAFLLRKFFMKLRSR